MIKKILITILMLSGNVTSYSQQGLQFIVGINCYNSEFEGQEFSIGYYNTKVYQTFYFSPQFGLQYNINKRHAIKYTHSYHVRFGREVVASTNGTDHGLMDIRSLDRLNYMFKFQNRTYLTSGFTYMLNKAQILVGTSSVTNIYGNMGINLGYGLEFKRGYIETNLLYALEFGEMTPALLYLQLDFGYYFNLTKAKEPEEIEVKKAPTLFSIGLVGAFNFFDKRAGFPVHSLLQPMIGLDFRYNVNVTGTSFFFRRIVGLHLIPLGFDDVKFFTQLNYSGISQNFTIKAQKLYASASYLAGFDAMEVFGTTLGGASKIQGFSLGLGYPVNNWAFELSADCYTKTPLPQIETGFGWDRIRASVIFNLPLITK